MTKKHGNVLDLNSPKNGKISEYFKKIFEIFFVEVQKSIF